MIDSIVKIHLDLKRSHEGSVIFPISQTRAEGFIQVTEGERAVHPCSPPLLLRNGGATAHSLFILPVQHYLKLF